jgi:hypothetical protein
MALHIKGFGRKRQRDKQAWKPALEQWAAHMDRYAIVHEDEDEAPFAYNERASVGLLAAGIVRASPDNVVLEEYGMSRERARARKKAKKLTKGRVDMWTVLGGRSYLVEGKYGTTSCQTTAPHFTTIRTSQSSSTCSALELVDEALAQARLYTDQPDRHVAAVFVVPELTRGNGSSFEEAWSAVRSESIDLGAHSGLVAYYLQDGVPVDPEADETRYPGTVLVLAFD